MQKTNDETQPSGLDIDATQKTSTSKVPPQGVNMPEKSGSQVDQESKLPGGSKRTRWGLIIFLAVLGLIIVAALSGYRGYQQGVEDRLIQQSTQQSETIERQYQLGLENFQSGEFELARQRFEYILEQDPNHPKAIEMLARTLAELFATATPTPLIPTVTPTLTSTPDMRNVEEKLNEARAHMNMEEWDVAIETLLALRKENPEFRAIDVDSMLYVALRNRGVQKILNKGELEGGLFDLSQAELFGPLDADAKGYSSWARFYIIGASFWEVDWGQAAYYFGQVAPYAPNLHDGTYWLASQRYVEAMMNYINQLADANEWCLAEEQASILYSFNGDSQIEPTAVYLEKKCKDD